MTYGFTGHRPPKLGGYTKEAIQKVYDFAYQTVFTHLNSGQDTVIIGMAIGWDMAVAEACIALDIEYTAAVPYPGQELMWPDPEVRKLYHDILDKAKRVVFVNQGERPVTIGRAATLLQLRNQWIVDHSEKIIALWDGEKVGGTWNCVKYARLKNLEIVNVWPDWEAFNI